MKIEGFTLTGFDAKKRSGKNKEGQMWYIGILTNNVGDRIHIRTGNKEIKNLLVGEDILLELTQNQSKIEDATEDAPTETKDSEATTEQEVKDGEEQHPEQG